MTADASALAEQVDTELMFDGRAAGSSAKDYDVEIARMVETNIQHSLRPAFSRTASAAEFGAERLADPFAGLNA